MYSMLSQLHVPGYSPSATDPDTPQTLSAPLSPVEEQQQGSGFDKEESSSISTSSQDEDDELPPALQPTKEIDFALDENDDDEELGCMLTRTVMTRGSLHSFYLTEDSPDGDICIADGDGDADKEAYTSCLGFLTTDQSLCPEDEWIVGPRLPLATAAEKTRQRLEAVLLTPQLLPLWFTAASALGSSPSDASKEEEQRVRAVVVDVFAALASMLDERKDAVHFSVGLALVGWCYQLRLIERAIAAADLAVQHPRPPSIAGSLPSPPVTWREVMQLVCGVACAGVCSDGMVRFFSKVVLPSCCFGVTLEDMRRSTGQQQQQKNWPAQYGVNGHGDGDDDDNGYVQGNAGGDGALLSAGASSPLLFQITGDDGCFDSLGSSASWECRMSSCSVWDAPRSRVLSLPASSALKEVNHKTTPVITPAAAASAATPVDGGPFSLPYTSYGLSFLPTLSEAGKSPRSAVIHRSALLESFEDRFPAYSSKQQQQQQVTLRTAPFLFYALRVEVESRRGSRRNSARRSTEDEVGVDVARWVLHGCGDEDGDLSGGGGGLSQTLSLLAAVSSSSTPAATAMTSEGGVCVGISFIAAILDAIQTFLVHSEDVEASFLPSLQQPSDDHSGTVPAAAAAAAQWFLGDPRSHESQFGCSTGSATAASGDSSSVPILHGHAMHYFWSRIHAAFVLSRSTPPTESEHTADSNVEEEGSPVDTQQSLSTWRSQLLVLSAAPHPDAEKKKRTVALLQQLCHRVVLWRRQLQTILERCSSWLREAHICEVLSMEKQQQQQLMEESPLSGVRERPKSAEKEGRRELSKSRSSTFVERLNLSLPSSPSPPSSPPVYFMPSASPPSIDRVTLSLMDGEPPDFHSMNSFVLVTPTCEHRMGSVELIHTPEEGHSSEAEEDGHPHQRTVPMTHRALSMIMNDAAATHRPPPHHQHQPSSLGAVAGIPCRRPAATGRFVERTVVEVLPVLLCSLVAQRSAINHSSSSASCPLAAERWEVPLVTEVQTMREVFLSTIWPHPSASYGPFSATHEVREASLSSLQHWLTDFLLFRLVRRASALCGGGDDASRQLGEGLERVMSSLLSFISECLSQCYFSPLLSSYRIKWVGMGTVVPMWQSLMWALLMLHHRHQQHHSSSSAAVTSLVMRLMTNVNKTFLGELQAAIHIRCRSSAPCNKKTMVLHLVTVGSGGGEEDGSSALEGEGDVEELAWRSLETVAWIACGALWTARWMADHPSNQPHSSSISKAAEGLWGSARSIVDFTYDCVNQFMESDDGRSPPTDAPHQGTSSSSSYHISTTEVFCCQCIITILNAFAGIRLFRFPAAAMSHHLPPPSLPSHASSHPDVDQEGAAGVTAAALTQQCCQRGWALWTVYVDHTMEAFSHLSSGGSKGKEDSDGDVFAAACGMNGVGEADAELASCAKVYRTAFLLPVAFLRGPQRAEGEASDEGSPQGHHSGSTSEGETQLLSLCLPSLLRLAKLWMMPNPASNPDGTSPSPGPYPAARHVYRLRVEGVWLSAYLIRCGVELDPHRRFLVVEEKGDETSPHPESSGTGACATALRSTVLREHLPTLLDAALEDRMRPVREAAVQALAQALIRPLYQSFPRCCYHFAQASIWPRVLSVLLGSQRITSSVQRCAALALLFHVFFYTSATWDGDVVMVLEVLAADPVSLVRIQVASGITTRLRADKEKAGDDGDDDDVVVVVEDKVKGSKDGKEDSPPLLVQRQRHSAVYQNVSRLALPLLRDLLKDSDEVVSRAAADGLALCALDVA